MESDTSVKSIGEREFAKKKRNTEIENNESTGK